MKNRILVSIVGVAAVALLLLGVPLALVRAAALPERGDPAAGARSERVPAPDRPGRARARRHDRAAQRRTHPLLRVRRPRAAHRRLRTRARGPDRPRRAPRRRPRRAQQRADRGGHPHHRERTNRRRSAREPFVCRRRKPHAPRLARDRADRARRTAGRGVARALAGAPADASDRHARRFGGAAR